MINNHTSTLLLLMLYQSYEVPHKIAHSLSKEDVLQNLFFGSRLLNNLMCTPEAIARKLNKKFAMRAKTTVVHPENCVAAEKENSPFSHRAEGYVRMEYAIAQIKIIFIMPANPLQQFCIPMGFAESVIDQFLALYLDEIDLGKGLVCPDSSNSESDSDSDSCQPGV